MSPKNEHRNWASSPSLKRKEINMKKVLKIEGMHCEGCVKRIENVLGKIKGVQNYKGSLEEKSIDLEIKNEKALEEIKQKIENLGFEVQE